jgi:hypothetical protein
MTESDWLINLCQFGASFSVTIDKSSFMFPILSSKVTDGIRIFKGSHLCYVCVINDNIHVWIEGVQKEFPIATLDPDKFCEWIRDNPAWDTFYSYL